MKIADVVIVGAGVIGSAIARELARFALRIVLTEQGSDVCGGASRANNGMIHSGNDPEPGTAKARHNVEGNRLYSEWAEELKFPFQRTGAWMTSRREEDIPSLERLMDKGARNGVPGLELITDPSRLRAEEPNCRIVAAVNAPSTGIVNPHLVVVALAENAARNGVEILLDTKVTGITVEADAVKGVMTSRGFIKTTTVVNAAGVHADEIARMAGLFDVTIRPRKGEYLLLDRCGSMVNRVIYPAPTPTTKGIGIIPTVEGNLLLGPTAVDVEDKEDASTTSEGMAKILSETLETCPSIDVSRVIASFAGVRAVAEGNDFIIGRTKVGGFFNAAGMQSPGLSSAPSVAREVAALVADHLGARANPLFAPENGPRIRFAALPWEERERLIRKDRRHGHIVCRCEHVTEREVIDALHSRVPPRTLDGLKIRLRVGMGRCQGGFCLPRIIRIFRQELGARPGSLTLKGTGTALFPGERIP